MIFINTLLATIKQLGTFSRTYELWGKEFTLHTLDYAAIVILVILSIIYLVSIIKDAAGYAKIDPMPQ